MKPTIGKTEEGHNLVIDIPRLLVTRMLVQASSGGGKSFALRRILEQTANHVQQVILDIEGEFTTLREKYDYVICAPQGADAIATPQTATILARRLRETRASAIIDMYEMKMPDRKKFVRLFLEEFVEAPKSMWHPCIVVVDEAHHFCLSDDTEILTRDGFKRYDEIVPEITEAVCFDTKSGAYSYGPVQRLIVREHDGEMVHLKSDGLDSLSTPDHRVVLKRVQRAVGRYKLYDWTFCQADKVPTCVGIPLGGAPVGSGIADLSLQDARILGWIITDGYWNGPRIGIEQSHATVKYGRAVAQDMDAILSTIEGVNRYDRAARVTSSGGRDRNHAATWSWYFSGSSSDPYLRWLGAELHRVPRTIIENASREQLEALYIGLLEGDGTAPNGKWVNFYPGHSGGLADDFQEIALRLGISTVKHFEKSINQWHVRIANERSMHWVRHPGRMHYSGIVWDVTVPTGAFVARRNGRVFVTGNCPEKDEAESMAAVNDLITRGRKRGLCGLLATQRLSKLNKDSAAELHNKLIGLAVLDTDVKRAADDLGMTVKEAMPVLRSLEPGEFFCFGPALIRAVTKIKVGPVITTHPEAGAGATLAPPPPSQKIKALLAKLTDLPKEAEQEARTLADYKREVTNLKRELTLAKKNADPAVIDQAVKQERQKIEQEIKTSGLKLQRQYERLKAFAEEAMQFIVKITADETLLKEGVDPETIEKAAKKAVDEIRKQIDARFESQRRLLENYRRQGARLFKDMEAFLEGARVPIDVNVSKQEPVVVSVKPHAPVPRRAEAGDSDKSLSPMDRAILTVLAQFSEEGCRANKLVLLAGYTLNGSTRNSFSKLRTLGFIVGSNTDTLRITQEGFGALGPYAPLPLDAEHLRHYWLNHKMLTPMDRAILKTLLDNPDGLEAESLCVQAGYTLNGSTRNSFSKLRTAGLIYGKNTETIRAAQELLQ